MEKWLLESENPKTKQKIELLKNNQKFLSDIDILKNKVPERAVGGDHLEEYRGIMEQMSWNPDTGYPTKETLADLNLDFVIKDLY